MGGLFSKVKVNSKVNSAVKVPVNSTVNAPVTVDVLENVHTDITGRMLHLSTVTANIVHAIFFHLNLTSILQDLRLDVRDAVRELWATFKVFVVGAAAVALARYAAKDVSVNPAAIAWLLGTVQAVLHYYDHPLARQLIVGSPMLLAYIVDPGNPRLALTMGPAMAGAGLVISTIALQDSFLAILALAVLVAFSIQLRTVFDACMTLGVGSLGWTVGAALGAPLGSQASWYGGIAVAVISTALTGYFFVKPPRNLEKCPHHERLTIDLDQGNATQLLTRFRGDIAGISVKVARGYILANPLTVTVRNAPITVPIGAAQVVDRGATRRLDQGIAGGGDRRMTVHERSRPPTALQQFAGHNDTLHVSMTQSQSSARVKKFAKNSFRFEDQQLLSLKVEDVDLRPAAGGRIEVEVWLQSDA